MTVLELKTILDTVRVQPDLAPRNGETFCNIALDRVLTLAKLPRMVDEKGQPLMANDMCDFMHDNPSQWEPVNGDAATARASQGMLVVACQQEAGHGHVCPVYPASQQLSGSWGKTVPMVSNVGKTVGVMRVSQAFRTEPDYYAYKG